MLYFLKNTLQLVLSPSRGWEDVAVSTRDIHEVVRHCLYPVLGVSALSVFVQLFYNDDVLLSTLVIKALVTFVSFFVTYFFALVMCSSFLYKFCDEEPTEHKYTTVVAYTVGLLAISTTICNVMPVNLGLKYLLPLAVTLILWKSDEYLKIRSDRDFFFIVFGIFVIILPPSIIQALFDLIL